MTATSYTPAVRAAARELGVNLSNLTGTGAGGRVTTADVKRAATPPPITDAQAEQMAAMLGVPKEGLMR